MIEYAIYDPRTRRVLQIGGTPNMECIDAMRADGFHVYVGKAHLNEVLSEDNEPMRVPTREDVFFAAHRGASDGEIMEMLLEMPEFGSEEEARFWMVDNYGRLREEAYPPIVDFIDATVKIESPDHQMRADGVREMAKYKAACLAVKARFPKK